MAITPGRFMPENIAPLGALTTNVAVQGEHVVANLIETNPSRYWRTPDSVNSGVITLDLPFKYRVDSVALCLHNLSISADVTIRLYDNLTLLNEQTVGALVPPYGIGVDPGYAQMGHGGFPLAADEFRHWPNTEIWFDQVYEADKIEITISDAGNVDNFLLIRYLMISRSYRPTETPYRNFEEGYTCGFVPSIATRVRPDGALIVRAETPAREMSAEWRHMRKAELIRMNQILRHIQEKNEPIYWSGFPEDTSQWGRQHAMLAYIVKWTPPHQIGSENVFSMTLREAMFNA